MPNTIYDQMTIWAMSLMDCVEQQQLEINNNRFKCIWNNYLNEKKKMLRIGTT